MPLRSKSLRKVASQLGSPRRLGRLSRSFKMLWRSLPFSWQLKTIPSSASTSSIWSWRSRIRKSTSRPPSSLPSPLSCKNRYRTRSWSSTFSWTKFSTLGTQGTFLKRARMQSTDSSQGRLPSSLRLKKKRRRTKTMMARRNVTLRAGRYPKMTIGKAA